MTRPNSGEELLPADKWLMEQSGVGPTKCPLCEVIQSANCPKFIWIAGLLEAYASYRVSKETK